MINKLREYFHYLRYKKIKSLIKTESKHLLDIGCGNPCDSMEDCAFLKYIGYGTGMDIIDRNLPKNLPLSFYKGSVTQMPFEDNSFETIIASEVLEHVEDVDKALSEIKRVLRPNGVFVMSTPNNTLFWKLIWFFWQKTYGWMWNDSHIIKYKTNEWKRILEKYFIIEKIEGFFNLTVFFKVRNNKSIEVKNGKSKKNIK